jgi:hypothetical protein
MEIIDTESYVVHEDETKIIFLKIIEQSIRDYFNLSKSCVPIEVQYFESASGFLFDEDYYIPWGDFEITLENILEYLQVDPGWFKTKLIDIMK